MAVCTHSFDQAMPQASHQKSEGESMRKRYQRPHRPHKKAKVKALEAALEQTRILHTMARSRITDLNLALMATRDREHLLKREVAKLEGILASKYQAILGHMRANTHIKDGFAETHVLAGGFRLCFDVERDCRLQAMNDPQGFLHGLIEKILTDMKNLLVEKLRIE